MPEQIIDLSFGGKGEETATLVNLPNDGEDEKATIENYEEHTGSVPEYHPLVNASAHQYPYNYSIPPAYYPMSYYMPQYYGYNQNYHMMAKAQQFSNHYDNEKTESQQYTPQMYIVDNEHNTEHVSSDSERSSQDESIPKTKYQRPDSEHKSSEKRNRKSRDALHDSSKKARKNRTSYNPQQIETLERAFHESPYPDSAMLETLSLELDLPESSLKIWFQNKRARWRKSKKELPKGATPNSGTASKKTSPSDIPQYPPVLLEPPAQIAPNPCLPQAYPADLTSHANGMAYMKFPMSEATIPNLMSNSSPTSTSDLSARTPSPELVERLGSEDTQTRHTSDEVKPQYPPFTHLFDMYQRYMC